MADRSAPFWTSFPVSLVTVFRGRPAFFSWDPMTVASSPYSDFARPMEAAAPAAQRSTVFAFFPNTASTPPIACWVREADSTASLPNLRIAAPTRAAGTAALAIPDLNLSIDVAAESRPFLAPEASVRILIDRIADPAIRSPPGLFLGLGHLLVVDGEDGRQVLIGRVLGQPSDAVSGEVVGELEAEPPAAGG